MLSGPDSPHHPPHSRDGEWVGGVVVIGGFIIEVVNMRLHVKSI